jgi:hypothetical protein
MDLLKGVTHYIVSIRIDTPCDDSSQFIPRQEFPDFSFYGIDPDTQEDEWPTHMWDISIPAEKLDALLDEYSIDEDEISQEDEQKILPQIGECLTPTFTISDVSYPSPYMNSIMILIDPIWKGLDPEIIRQHVRLVKQ